MGENLDRPGAWNYTGNPADSDRDHVRFLVGDVDESDKQVSDEEIAYLLTDESDVFGAAARACEHLATKYARKAQRSVSAGGGHSSSISLSERSKAYREQAKDYRERSATTGGVSVFAGGLSKDGKDTVESDTDRVEPAFHRGMFDNAS